MARKRRSDPILQKVRQLARSGKRAAAGELLESTLRQNPNHQKAREEYNRFLIGKPFTFEAKDYEELQGIISEFLSSPQMLVSMRSAGIRRLQKRVRYLQHAQEHMLSAMEKKTLSQLRSNSAKELKRRRKPLGKAAIIGGVILAVLALLSGIFCFLWKRAENAAEILDAAGKSNITRAAAQNLLSIHDTGLNRTLNRRVSVEADNLRAYMRAQQRRARELDAILKVIEKGEQSVVGQGVRRRAEIERKLKLLGKDGSKLQGRWDELCAREKESLNQQRLSLSEELMAPLPPSQSLKNNPQEDLAILNKRQKTLQQRINIFEDAGVALNLSKELIEPAEQEYAQNQKIIAEITQFRNLLKLLPAAHDYETYKSQITSWSPQLYTPAMDMLRIGKRLPEQKNLKSLMQEHGQNVKPGLLLAARKSLLEGGASFSEDFPATREQLAILEELLENQALKTRLCEYADPVAKEQALTETTPEIRMGRFCLRRSALDPARDAAERKLVEWHNPDAVVRLRVIDPRPLYTKLGFENRAGFLTTANLPRLLTDIFQIEGNDIPALARAYVFYHLVNTINKAQEPLLNGLRYAPEMQKALASFEKLREACQVRLDGNCWLYSTPKYQAAERKYAAWFRKHRKLNFQQELQENMGELMRVTPQFCGYVNEYGEATLFESMRPGETIWYIRTDGSVATGAHGDKLNSPHLLSPVFTKEKQL